MCNYSDVVLYYSFPPFCLSLSLPPSPSLSLSLSLSLPSLLFLSLSHPSLSSKPDALVAQTTQHTGAVRTLDVNPFQPNLLASGASDSEIFIWDLTNPSTP